MSKRFPIAQILRCRFALAALAFTYLFFAEYLSPFRKVWVPFDLWGYHYPLMDAAFQRLQHGSFPAWDPSIYCGQPFAANIQAALFYPPTWILYAFSALHGHLTYTSVEAFVFAHLWLGFVLFFCWLRGKGLADLACILGAAVFAYSGFATLQVQHFGLICGYAWLPLGLWGIDDRGRWGLFKIVAASALCFLAGYPPMWTVLAIFLLVYGAFARRFFITLAAMVASLMVVAVQLVPTIEASSFMLKENRYGDGIRDLWLSYLLPNFYHFGIDVPSSTNFGHDYLYLGAPAIVGLILFRAWRPALPILAAGAVSVIFLTNPFHFISNILGRFEFLSQICRDWYFLAGVTAAVAALAAMGLDGFLTSAPRRKFSEWIAASLATAWAAYELMASQPSGWWSALAALGTIAVFTLCLFTVRSHSRMIVALLLCVAVDYKVNGTSKRFNGLRGSIPHQYAREGFFGIDSQALGMLKAHPNDRILLDFTAPMPVELRHHGLTSPQGFDPFISTQYISLVKELGAQFQTSREFTLDPDSDEAMDALGVRYAITTESGPLFAHFGKFKLVGSGKTYFRVYERELHQPEPIYRTPEIRRYRATGGIVFKEQFFPGWTATVDGHPTQIRRWRGTFQTVDLPPGEHVVEFRYRPNMVYRGAWISVASLVLLLFAHLPGRLLSLR